MPAAPTNALAVHIGQGAVALAWEPSVDEVRHYEVWASSNLAGPYFKYMNSIFNEPRGVVFNVPVGSTAYFRVRALGVDGNYSSFEQAYRGVLQYPQASMSVEAIAGSIIPEGAVFGVADTAGRLVAYSASDDILITDVVVSDFFDREDSLDLEQTGGRGNFGGDGFEWIQLSAPLAIVDEYVVPLEAESGTEWQAVVDAAVTDAILIQAGFELSSGNRCAGVTFRGAGDNENFWIARFKDGIAGGSPPQFTLESCLAGVYTEADSAEGITLDTETLYAIQVELSGESITAKLLTENGSALATLSATSSSLVLESHAGIFFEFDTAEPDQANRFKYFFIQRTDLEL